MIRLIAAIDRQRGMAKHGFQPWSIPEDEAYFTRMTKDYGGVVLVGSTTYKTFHGPLKDRQNFVLTHDQTPIKDIELVHDLEAFVRQYAHNDLWVVGGAQVFGQVIDLGLADELYLTKIEADFGCDQYFPEYDNHFQLTEQGDLREQNGFIYSYCRYTRAVK